MHSIGRVSLLALACLPALAANRVLLLIEDTPGIRQAMWETTLPKLSPDDRMAVVTFSGKIKVRQEFTGDLSKLSHALGLARRGFRFGRTSSRTGLAAPANHPLHALEQACRLFGAGASETRAVILLFGSEESAATPGAPEVERALAGAHARLYAVAVRLEDTRLRSDPRLQTPPTIPGRNPPVQTGFRPLPEATIKLLAPVAKSSGGELILERWDLPAIWHRL